MLWFGPELNTSPVEVAPGVLAYNSSQSCFVGTVKFSPHVDVDQILEVGASILVTFHDYGSLMS